MNDFDEVIYDVIYFLERHLENRKPLTNKDKQKFEKMFSKTLEKHM